MISGGNSFYVLGMNIGANERDYQLLLPHVGAEINPNTSLSDLLIDLERAAPENRAPLIEKIFFILENSQKPLSIDAKNPLLATLIFEQGLDILDKEIKNPQFNQIITNNEEAFLKEITKYTQDKTGATTFWAQYPNLSLYITEKYSDRIPLLATHKPQNVVPTQDSLQVRHQQELKNRLADAFFREAVTCHEKPAVISLQEVSRSNRTVLDTLKDYTIIQDPNDTSLALAIDNTRFKNIQNIPSNPDTYSVFAYAQEKTSSEPFIFVSTHIPGYPLEKTASLNESHLKNSTAYISNLNSQLNQLKTQYPQATIVIEGDFNTYPEYFEEEQTSTISEKIASLNIFSFLKNLTLFRTNQPTELNQKSSFKERELDYFFISPQLKDRFTLHNPKNPQLRLVNEEKEGSLHFDPSLLFSDHRPLWAKITLKPSWLATAKQKISSLFRKRT